MPDEFYRPKKQDGQIIKARPVNPYRHVTEEEMDRLFEAFRTSTLEERAKIQNELIIAMKDKVLWNLAEIANGVPAPRIKSMKVTPQ